MELSEMIKVMQHFEDGGDVEFSNDQFKTILGKASKTVAGNLSWDWDSVDYRIKEQKQKVTIEKWLCQDKQGTFLIIETSSVNHYKLYKKIKLIESYEIEL